MSRIIRPNIIPEIGRPKLEDFPFMSEAEISGMTNSLFHAYTEGMPVGVPHPMPMGALIRFAKTLTAYRTVLEKMSAALDVVPLDGSNPAVSFADRTAAKTLLGAPDVGAADVAKYHGGGFS